MPQPRRHLPSRTEIPWDDLRRRAGVVYEYVRRGWSELSAAERTELGRLLRKSKGRPRNLSKDEARRFGQLIARAAAAATARERKR
jgi:hypothetical protein